jgi:hypothetical protein
MIAPAPTLADWPYRMVRLAPTNCSAPRQYRTCERACNPEGLAISNAKEAQGMECCQAKDKRAAVSEYRRIMAPITK